MWQAGYRTLAEAKAQLDSAVLRNLRQVYGSTQKRKETRVTRLAETWRKECVELLSLESCSDYQLGFMVKVADHKMGLDQANTLQLGYSPGFGGRLRAGRDDVGRR